VWVDGFCASSSERAAALAGGYLPPSAQLFSADGSNGSPAEDLYSLGAVLLRVLSGQETAVFRDPRSGTLLFRGRVFMNVPLAEVRLRPMPARPASNCFFKNPLSRAHPGKCSTFTSLMWVRAIAGRAVVGTDRSGEGVRRTLLVAEAGARSSCSVGHCTSADRPRRVAAKQCRCCKRADDAGSKACGHTGRNQRRRRHAARGRIA